MLSRVSPEPQSLVKHVELPRCTHHPRQGSLEKTGAQKGSSSRWGVGVGVPRCVGVGVYEAEGASFVWTRSISAGEHGGQRVTAPGVVVERGPLEGDHSVHMERESLSVSPVAAMRTAEAKAIPEPLRGRLHLRELASQPPQLQTLGHPPFDELLLWIDRT